MIRNSVLFMIGLFSSLSGYAQSERGKQEKTLLLDEVVVTGQFAPQSLRNSLYKIRLITSEQIREKAATDIQSLLKTEIGIRMSNDPALGETDFELMGMSGNNIKVLVNGVPLLDRLSRKQSLSQIDINSIDRVEIVEGPMSVIYGSDALAGVINIITKGYAAGGKKGWRAGARLQEETIGREYNAFTGKGEHMRNVSAGYHFKNGIYLSGSFTHKESGGWQGTYTGRAKQWQPKTQFLPGWRMGYQGKYIDVEYRVDYANENILTEADINSLVQKTSDKEFLVDRYTQQLQGNWRMSRRFSLSVASSYQDYSRRTRTTSIDLKTNRRTLSLERGAQDQTNFSSWFGRVTGNWTLSPLLKLQPGIEFQRTVGEGDRMEGNHPMNNTALFLSAEYTPVDWLHVRPGIRTTRNSVFAAPKAIPALNVKLDFNSQMALRLSYGSGYRAPTLQELYYSFHDSNHNIDGNPDLRAEASDSYLASLTGSIIQDKDMRLTASLSGFYNLYKNRISLVESVDKPGYLFYYNIDRYKTTGLVLESAFAWKSLSASVNLSCIGRYNELYEDKSIDASQMAEFRYSPELSVNVSYDWRKVASFNLFYKFTGQRQEYMLSSDKAVVLQGLNGFHWGDFTATRRITPYLAASVGVRNLFDVTFVKSNINIVKGAHGSTFSGSQVGSGRSCFVGLVLEL